PPFVSVIERHAQPLASVTSDTEALALFSSQLAPSLNLGTAPAPDQQQIAGQLVAELAAWRLALAVRKAADADDQAALPPLFQAAAAQRNWLLANNRFPALGRVLAFSEAPPSGDPARMAMLAALAFRAEAEAERNARSLWDRLQSWNEQLKAQKAVARLCGTWLWTIHNHKNHQEQKITIVLLPPETPVPPDMPQPAKMVVLGDAVYLRWDFQRGYQEDSLLFVKEGRHLEGTFMNTAGDWGAITGKRVAPCTR
ncbi:MAG TPA: hypothetical protein VIG89_04145, partial [Candidatus Acidoferrales bacterium]